MRTGFSGRVTPDTTYKEDPANAALALKSASDALKTRICYVTQVVIFLFALVGLVIGLTVGYNKNEKDDNNESSDCEFSDIAGDGFCDDEANIYTCQFDEGDCCGDIKVASPCLQCMCYGKYTVNLKQY